MSERVTFTWDAGRVRLIGGTVAVIAAGGLIMFVQNGWDAKVFGIAWIAVLLSLALLLFERARAKGPVVTIDACGIHDNRLSPTPIPWDDIESVGTLDAEQLTFVAIDLKPNASAWQMVKPTHRALRSLNRLLHFPSLSIGMHALDGTSEDLIAAVRRFRPDLVQSHEH